MISDSCGAGGNHDSIKLKDKSSCVHIENLKKERELKSFKILRGLFVSCITTKAEENSRLHGCLYCGFLEWEGKDIQQHFKDDKHPLAIDINSGHVYCFECKDYKYDLEEISKEQ